jgi:hypothetical protein
MGNQPSSLNDSQASGARDVESSGQTDAAPVTMANVLLQQEPETAEAVSDGGQAQVDKAAATSTDAQVLDATTENGGSVVFPNIEEGLTFQQMIHEERRKRDALFEVILSDEANPKNISTVERAMQTSSGTAKCSRGGFGGAR